MWRLQTVTSHSMVQGPCAWCSGCSRAASAPGARGHREGRAMPALSSPPPVPFVKKQKLSRDNGHHFLSCLFGENRGTWPPPAARQAWTEMPVCSLVCLFSLVSVVGGRQGERALGMATESQSVPAGRGAQVAAERVILRAGRPGHFWPEPTVRPPRVPHTRGGSGSHTCWSQDHFILVKIEER